MCKNGHYRKSICCQDLHYNTLYGTSDGTDGTPRVRCLNALRKFTFFSGRSMQLLTDIYNIVTCVYCDGVPINNKTIKNRASSNVYNRYSDSTPVEN